MNLGGPAVRAVLKADRLLRRRRLGWGTLGIGALAVSVGLGALSGPWAAVAAISAERRAGLGVRASLVMVGLTLLSAQAGFWRGRDRKVWTVLGAPSAAVATLARLQARRVMGGLVLLAVSALWGWSARAEASVWALWWITALAWLPEAAVLSVLAVTGPAGRPGGAPWLDAIRGSSPPESAGILVGNALPFVGFGLLTVALAAALRVLAPTQVAAAVLVFSVLAHLALRAAWPRRAQTAYEVSRALALSDLRDDVLTVSAHASPAPAEAWLSWGDPTPSTRMAWRRVWRRDRPAVLLGVASALATPWMSAGWERDLVGVAFAALLGGAVLVDADRVQPWWRRSLGERALGSLRLWWTLVAAPSALLVVGSVASGAAWRDAVWLVVGPAVQRATSASIGPRAAWLGGAVAWVLGSLTASWASGGLR